jgi:hypothetical protein
VQILVRSPAHVILIAHNKQIFEAVENSIRALFEVAIIKYLRVG